MAIDTTASRGTIPRLGQSGRLAHVPAPSVAPGRLACTWRRRNGQFGGPDPCHGKGRRPVPWPRSRPRQDCRRGAILPRLCTRPCQFARAAGRIGDAGHLTTVAPAAANHRTIFPFIRPEVRGCCQPVPGCARFPCGSVRNIMPARLQDRPTEAPCLLRPCPGRPGFPHDRRTRGNPPSGRCQ
jgi:hypothetical protein